MRRSPPWNTGRFGDRRGHHHRRRGQPVPRRAQDRGPMPLRPIKQQTLLRRRAFGDLLPCTVRGQARKGAVVRPEPGSYPKHGKDRRALRSAHPTASGRPSPPGAGTDLQKVAHRGGVRRHAERARHHDVGVRVEVVARWRRGGSAPRPTPCRGDTDSLPGSSNGCGLRRERGLRTHASVWGERLWVCRAVVARSWWVLGAFARAWVRRPPALRRS